MKLCFGGKEKNMKIKSKMAVISCALVFLGTVQVHAAGEEKGKTPSIRVRGEGHAEAVPDEATVSFGITSEEKYLEKAYRDNTARMNAVIETVKKMGIAPKDIQTSSFNVSPFYRDEKSGRPLKPSGFTVSQQLTVLLRDTSKTGPLIDKIISDGANVFNGIQFGSSKVKDMVKEAKVQAAKNAKESAVLLAESLGVKLGRLMDVSDEVVRPYPAAQPRMMAMFAADKAAPPQIEGGSMEVTAYCNVEYAIAE